MEKVRLLHKNLTSICSTEPNVRFLEQRVRSSEENLTLYEGAVRQAVDIVSSGAFKPSLQVPLRRTLNRAMRGDEIMLIGQFRKSMME